MSRNIKEIGKELMGKSLNSFHRKTGLTQLEENNKMQDGILDGILSQVDDAYIEKTEQSNVIHLDGSGDGVVVLDGIEGNTMVNLATMDNWREGKSSDTHRKVTITSPTSWKKVYKFFHLKPNTTYTIFIKITNNSDATSGKMYIRYVHNQNATPADGSIGDGQTGVFNKKITLNNTGLLCLTCESGVMTGDVIFEDLLLLEGDWTNRDLPPYFQGLQSSFEEKVNEQGKYEIEILSQNENIFNIDSANTNHIVQNNGNLSSNSAWVLYDYEPIAPLQNIVVSEKCVNGRYFQYRMCYYDKDKKFISTKDLTGYDGYKTDITPMGAKYFRLNHSIAVNGNSVTREEIMVSYGTTYRKEYVPYKQNKIKLLLDEPLRSLENVKDRLCIKDNKLIVERNYGELTLNSNSNIEIWNSRGNCIDFRIAVQDIKHSCKMLSDKFTYLSWNTNDVECCTVGGSSHIYIRILKSKLNEVTVLGFKTWLQSNPIKIVYELTQPTYEEVLNEYGEPIILEGYENGTIYIDSTIVPTTTIRYTPKMESFKTLKEVENNNIMLTNDVNDNIIPYMMDVDLMIMEKEMALMSHKNIRTIGVKDMTSMQKRTQDMLERLIKGKTLTEQECKTRVVTYLNAGKITDEQAKELNFLIDEIYA